MKKVCIDPGHGGEDSGAFYHGLKEKNVVLQISHYLKEIFDFWDYDVVLTRTRDYFLSLSKRAEIANEEKVDVFLSIHTNAWISKKATGIETYHFPGSNEGFELAYLIQQRLIENIRSNDRGVKTARFTVLRRTDMPAVLCEVGFISNKQENKLLSKEHIRYMKAFSIAKSVDQYFKRR